MKNSNICLVSVQLYNALSLISQQVVLPVTCFSKKQKYTDTSSELPINYYSVCIAFIFPQARSTVCRCCQYALPGIAVSSHL